MKGLKLQLKKIQGIESQQQNQQQDENKNSYTADYSQNQQDEQNNISDISNSMIKSRIRSSSTMEIIEEVETRREQFLKKSIQNLTEREEDNYTDNDEDDFSEDTQKQYCNSAPEKGLIRSKQDGSEGESQDSCNENSSPMSARSGSPIKKAIIQKKRMSVIDECLDQIRKRRDLIAAKLISNTYELDEDLLDSSDLSDIDQQQNESKFNLSQKFNSGNTNKTLKEKDVNTNDQQNNNLKDEILQTSKTTEESQSQSSNTNSLNNSSNSNNVNNNNSNINNNQSKLNENLPLISIEKLDSIINPISGISPSSKSSSPKKPQQTIKLSQVGNNMKQSTVKQSQFLGMSRNFGGRFDLRKSSMYQNIGGLAQSRMVNATSSNLKRSSVFCFEGFQDRQFARQLQKIQEDEDKSLVRQFETFIEQIKKEKEIYVSKIKQKRDNIKDFFKDNSLEARQKLQQQNGQDKDNSKKSKNSSVYKVFQKDGEDQDKFDFASSINLQDVKNNKNESNTFNQYKINFQEYEDLNVYQLLERIEEEFLSKKQMDPQMSQFLRESMMMSTVGGQSLAFGENMEKTFFPLVVTEQDLQNFEIKKQLDEMGEKIKHKNLIKLEQMLEKQKRDLKELEIEHCKLQIDYQIFQQNEQLKQQLKQERMMEKKKKKQIAKLTQSVILNQSVAQELSLGDDLSDDENNEEDANNLSNDQSNSILNQTIAMNNQNFEERQKNVIEIFNELCAEYGILKENLQKIKQNFNLKNQECLDKFTFLQNVNNNIDQVLEYNQSIFQFQQKSKNIIYQQNPSEKQQDEEDQVSYLVNQIENLEQAIQNRQNESDIEFQFKKTKRINLLLAYKVKLEKLQYQRDFEGLLIDIAQNSETLMKEKELLQELLKQLKYKFEEMKEYNTVYKDQIIIKQLNDIEQLKIEIENNYIIQRDLNQKYNQYYQVVDNLIQQKSNNKHTDSFNHSQNQQNMLIKAQNDLVFQKQYLVNEIEKIKLQNNKLENDINGLQFNQLNSILIKQNIYLEQIKKENNILI